MTTPEHRILDLLTALYGEETAGPLYQKFHFVLQSFSSGREERPRQGPPERFSEKDAILITYADQFQGGSDSPLASLGEFAGEYLGEAILGIHLLPFFPYSSDDGFSVIDYRRVDPQSGGWQHIEQLGENYRLMFDAVVNHISQESDWFQAYRRIESPFDHYFIEVDPGLDLSQVVRPRALPLLTPVQTRRGPRYVWTTFSDDQIDLNYTEPDVLLEMTELLLFYVERGAEIIRLDAVAFLWKDLATPCIHLPQTHLVIKLWRAVLDAVAPSTLLITETNVPHLENISYFGDGSDEAQMVYQFPLAPLVLNAFQTGDARKLSAWAASLQTPSPETTFFNFIASHDGIGVRPAEGILTGEEIASLVATAARHGGRVSYRNNPDGTQSVYELNITLFDFLNDPGAPGDLDIPRFLASQAIMLSLAGVPGIYVHSLLGSRNCQECVQRTGRNRSINRQKFSLAGLQQELNDPGSRAGRVLSGYLQLLQVRGDQAAFHPNVPQQVLELHPAVLALARRPAGRSDEVIALINVASREIELQLDVTGSGAWRDLLDGQAYAPQAGSLQVHLSPYQTRWLGRQPA